MTRPLPFIDLQAQRARISDRIDRAIAAVLEHGQYIMGPEIERLETALAGYCEVGHAVSCSSGTDALLLALMAEEIGPGDAVLLPSFTFPATAEVVALVGASPVFVDVLPDTFNMDPASVHDALAMLDDGELRARAVMPVDLFGQPADYPEITTALGGRDVVMIADAAQSFGGTLDGTRVGSWGRTTATSFFPAKPLGAYGDGGAVFTDDPHVAELLRSLRLHGQGADKYDIARIGINGRLDTLQAAVLIEKLAIFDDELATRDRIAARYTDGLGDVAVAPHLMPAATTAWAQYTLQLDDRDGVAARLRSEGIPTAVYYPVPMHLQAPYVQYPRAPGGLKVSEELAARVLSLPMHPYLDEATQDRIIAAVRAAVTGE